MEVSISLSNPAERGARNLCRFNIRGLGDTRACVRVTICIAPGLFCAVKEWKRKRLQPALPYEN